MPQLKYEKLMEENEDTTNEIRQRIKQARKIQLERFKNANLTNSEMDIPQIKKYCQIPLQSQSVLRQCVNSGKLSARGYHRVLKVARTIADLDNSEKISNIHFQEALMYRTRSNEQ